MNKKTTYFPPTEEFRQKHFEEMKTVSGLFESLIAGKSILGREIFCYKIGRGNRRIMLFGAHHAMEYMTASLLYDFVDFLSEKCARGGVYYGINIEYLLQKFEFWVFPCVNPDGVEMHFCGAGENPLRERQIKMNGGSDDFSDWQSNARGVDLNHNYNAGFFEYKRIFEKSEGIVPGKGKYSGEYPESEPEVRTVASYIRSLMPSLVISLHSQGEEIYCAPSEEKTYRLARRAAAISGYSVSAPEGGAAYGGLSDFSGGLGIPSLTVEVGKGKNPLPHEKFPVINESVRKMLYLLPTYL